MPGYQSFLKLAAFILCLAGLSYLAGSLVIAKAHRQNPAERNSQATQPNQPNQPNQSNQSINTQLEEERLAALPALKAELEQPRLRERADMIFIIHQALFNKVLNEITTKKFNAGGLFSVSVVNPRVTIKNGQILAHMDAEITPLNSLLSFTSTLAVTARVAIEQAQDDALIAKVEVVDLKPAGNGDQAQQPSPISPDQLSKLLPPIQLPLELDFDRTFQPGVIKQNKPIAYELRPEARRIRGHLEVTELLPLQGRLVVMARMKNLMVK